MTLHVLAVDDSHIMRGLLKLALTAARFRVTTAEDGLDGLDKLAGIAPDVILSDLNMPRLDGFGFIRAVRSDPARRGVPILCLTSESAPHLRSRARDLGATGWIVKPFVPDDLIAAIFRVSGRIPT